MTIRIDSHQHFWKLDEPFNYGWLDRPDLAPIRRNFLPDDLEPLLKASDIDRTIVVQTQHNRKENDWALGLADQHPRIAGVVGWVNLASNECESELIEAISHPKFVGVRHITQDEPDDEFILMDSTIRGLKVLEKHHVPFDLLFYVKHLQYVPALVAQVPDLPLVIDHLAKPQISENGFEAWRHSFQVAAHYPNVFCKLSGLITEANWQTWKPDDLRPYVQAALDSFGPKRLMFGSDWPVSTLAGSYPRWIEALDEALGPISETERSQIFGQTAARFYGLSL